MSSKILFIEDDEFIADLYLTKLDLSGLEVRLAKDGQEGIQMANKGNYDLVLLDLLLPKINGFKVLEKIKQDEKYENTPVVILSNLGQQQEVEKGLNMGADEYLIKAHFTPQEVVEKIINKLKEKPL